MTKAEIVNKISAKTGPDGSRSFYGYGEGVIVQ